MKTGYKVTIKHRDDDGDIAKVTFEMSDLAMAVLEAIDAIGGNTIEVLADAVEWHCECEGISEASPVYDEALGLYLAASKYTEALKKYRKEVHARHGSTPVASQIWAMTYLAHHDIRKAMSDRKQAISDVIAGRKFVATSKVKYYTIFRVLGGPKAGCVDFLDIVPADSMSAAESHAEKTYDHSAADWFDIEEYDTFDAALGG